MRFLLILAFTVGMQLSCATASPTTSAESGFKFFDKHTQSLFIEKLKSEGVGYRMREDGTVLYDSKDEGRVGRIRMAILQESYVPSAHFPDLRLEQRFVEQLKSHRVRFAIEEKHGKRWVSWSERDDEEVQKIRKFLLESQ